MAAFLDNCRFNPTAGGVADFVYSTVITGYQSPAAAGAVDGRKYKYMAISSDQSTWEMGEGTWTAASTTLSRTTVLYNSAGTGTATGQSRAGTKIDFASAPQVFIIGIKEDMLAFDEPNNFSTAQQETARVNLLANPITAFTGTVVESHAAGAVTFAVKTMGGADPSALTPVVFAFQNGAGGVAFVSVTAPLSITVPSGATLGQTANGAPFRVWIAAFNDGGTVRLAVYTSSANKLGFTAPLEDYTASSTLTPGGSSQVFYTTGAAVTSKYWMWIANATYESGLATAGTWAVSPTVLALVDESSPRPGDIIQCLVSPGPSGALSVSDTTGTYDVISQNFTMLSAANLVEVDSLAYIYFRTGAAGAQGTLVLTNGTASISPGSTSYYNGASTDFIGAVNIVAYDKPNALSVTYKLRASNSSSGSGTIQYSGWNFRIREIFT